MNIKQLIGRLETELDRAAADRIASGRTGDAAFYLGKESGLYTAIMLVEEWEKEADPK